MMKLTGIMIAAKMPKARIGRMLLSAFDRKAIAVVLLVTKMALKALRKL